MLELGVFYWPLWIRRDVVTINVPLHPENEHLFNDALIAKMKWGVYLVNTARGKICSEAAAQFKR